MKKPRRLFKGTESLLASLASVLAGLLFGFVLLLIFNPAKAGDGFLNILLTGVRSTARLGKVFYTAAPLVMTGLAVGFAFKTGLFNIGATGQFTVGGTLALFGAIAWQLPWYLCLLLAILGGAVWGSIPGLCKALFNVNEVITSIMFNWIALFTVNLAINNTPVMLASSWGDVSRERTASLAKANLDAILPKLGLDKLMRYNGMNIAIFIAVLVALLMWFILQRTTFGYELKAVGANRHASRYAGISDGRSIIQSMIIAGALAGLGGGLYYLSGTVQFTLGKELVAMGFNGIPVALLGASHPIGIIFSALFISYIQVGGDAMQPEFAREMIDIIIASIIYLSAFSLLMRELIRRAKLKRGMAQEEATVKGADGAGEGGATA